MTGDEAVIANRDNMFEISKCLRRLSNDLTYIEGVVRTWIFYFKEGHQHSKPERELFVDRFFKMLKEQETIFGLSLVSRSALEECIRSDSIEDWQNIFIKTLPDFRTEVMDGLQKPLNKFYALPRPLWSSLLPDSFAKQVIPPFLAGQYLSAVRRGCDALRAVIRERTGLHHLDGVDLVNQAYGKDSPFLVAVWEGHSGDNIQRGYSDMLRGAMAAIRNVHYHGTDEITDMEAARLLVILGTLWVRADTTTKDC